MHHQEAVLPGDHGVVERVLEVLGARREDLPRAVGVERVEGAVLRGGLRARGDHQEAVAAAAAHADVEPTVGLVVDQLVVDLVGAERVPPDLVGAPGVVDGRVVEGLARGVPGDTAEHAGDLVVEQAAGAQVLDPDDVPLVAHDVDRVGQQVPVEADAGAAEGEVLVALRELVEVEQHLLAGQGRLVGGAVLGRLGRGPVVGGAHRHPAAGAVLAALEGPAVVPVAAVAGRHRQVGLLGACLDLAEDRRAQVGQVRGALLGPGVLRLEVGQDLGRVLVAQPVVLVGARAAVVLGGDRTARSEGGCEGWGDSGAIHVRNASPSAPRRGAPVPHPVGDPVHEPVEEPQDLWMIRPSLWRVLCNQKYVAKSAPEPLRRGAPPP